MKNNFKTKIFFVLCILITIVLLVALALIYMGELHGTSLATDKELFDTDFCDGKCSDNVYKKAIKTPYTCKMCGNTFSHPNTYVPKYCNLCASSVGKCPYCDKFFSVYSR